MDLWQRIKSQTEMLPILMCLTVLSEHNLVEWTQSLLKSPGRTAGGMAGGAQAFIFTRAFKPVLLETKDIGYETNLV